MIEEKRKKKIDYKIQLAVVNDLEEIHQIIIDRCNWFLKKNIKQWNINHYPKKYNLEYFKEQMKINKLYVAKTKNRVIGVMLLKETDKEYWLDNKNAFYIHHLATSIDYTGVGNALLTFAINQAKRRKKEVRLSNIVNNSGKYLAIIEYNSFTKFLSFFKFLLSFLFITTYHLFIM